MAVQSLWSGLHMKELLDRIEVPTKMESGPIEKQVLAASADQDLVRTGSRAL